MATNGTMGLASAGSIGFIGLGLMGQPMAVNLASKLEQGQKLYVYDLVESAMDELVKQFPGVVYKGSSIRDVAEKSDTIFTMLPEGRHVEQVFTTGDDCICAIDASNKLLIDSSTIDTATNLRVKEYINQHHPTASFYDAPVSGGTIGAIKATIAFFLGADESDPNLPKLKTLLSTMGSQIIPCGGPSLGLVAKLCNNYLSGTITIATSEAFDMGLRSGMDPRTLYKVFGAGTAQNTICDKFCPVPGVVPGIPSSNGYKGGFKVQLMKKDYTLAYDMAKRVGAGNVLGEVGLKTWQQASEAPNCKDLDSRVVYRFLGGKEDALQ